MDSGKAASQISTLFRKLTASDPKIHNAYLLVHSDRTGFHLNLAAGETKSALGTTAPAHPEQPVYMASVGKLFTAVLVALLSEQGKLSFEGRIADFLDPGFLDGLHVYKGQDYSRQIRIKHLLNHTSGLHDYFEDKPREGPGMIDRLLDDPDRAYRPQEIITWSKQNLAPHFPPGQGFHYSDTGYHLLGLVVEAVASLPFHAALSRFIFDPLEMKHAFLLGHSQPMEESPYPVAGAYVGHTNIVHYRSLSADYAGGGVTAPLPDLLKFMQALAKGRLLNAETFRRMDDCAKFLPGIDYCSGMMKIRTVPVLMPARFNCWGNAGSTGAFLFYHPGTDAYLIGSLNQFRYHAKGIRFMLRVIDPLLKNDP
jgi:D-alanyl-D-alanine carboxypeptidase